MKLDRGDLHDIEHTKTWTLSQNRSQRLRKRKKQECEELVLPLTGLQLIGFTYVTSGNQAKMTKAEKQYCLRLLKNPLKRRLPQNHERS